MASAERAGVGGYLADLARLTARGSAGPFRLSQVDDGGHAVTAAGGRRPLAIFARQADAEFFVRALSDLRAMAAALVETLGLHRDTGGGVCAQDGQQVPCLTRRVIIAQLPPLAAES